MPLNGEESENNSLRAAHAAEDAACAAENAEYLAEQLLDAEYERASRQALRDTEKHAQQIVSIAKRIEKVLPNEGATLEYLWGGLAEISSVIGNRVKWDVLLYADVHGIQYAYATLRKRIVRCIHHVNSIDRDKKIPADLLRSLAYAFIHFDICQAVELKRRCRLAKDQLMEAKRRKKHRVPPVMPNRSITDGFGFLFVVSIISFASITKDRAWPLIVPFIILILYIPIHLINKWKDYRLLCKEKKEFAKQNEAEDSELARLETALKSERDAYFKSVDTRLKIIALLNQ